MQASLSDWGSDNESEITKIKKQMTNKFQYAKPNFQKFGISLLIYGICSRFIICDLEFKT